MQRPLDPMNTVQTETPSAAYVLRRRYGPARFVIVAITWATVLNLVFQPVVMAASLYWDANWGAAGADAYPYGVWGVDPFWNTDPTGGGGGTLQTATTSGDAVFFVAGPGPASGSTPYTVTLSGAQPALGITFQSPAAATLTGGNVSLYAGGISVPQYAYGSTDNAAQVINSPVTLNAAQVWANNSANVFTISGNIANGANLLTIGGAGNTTISGILGNGAGGLTKTGTGTLTLAAANTFTGPVTLSQGKVALSNTGGLGTTGTVSPADGATLELLNDGSSPAWSPVFTSGTLDFSAASLTILAGRATAGNGNAPQMSGAVTLGGAKTTSVAIGANAAANTAYSLTFSGTSTLNGTHTFNVSKNGTGAATVYLGTLALNAGGSGGTLDASGDGQVQFNAFTANSKPLTLGSGTGGSILNNASAMNMNSQKFTVAGDTVYLQQNLTPSNPGGLDLTGGTLVANYNYGDGSAAVGILNYGNMTFLGGALETCSQAWYPNNGPNNTRYATGNIDLSQGNGTWKVSGPTAGYSGRYHALTGNVTLGNARNFTLAGGSNWDGASAYYGRFLGTATFAATASQTFTVNSLGNLYLGGAMTVPAGGATITKEGAGVLQPESITFNGPLSLAANGGDTYLTQAFSGSPTINISGSAGRVIFNSNSNNSTATINLGGSASLMFWCDADPHNAARIGTVVPTGTPTIQFRSNQDNPSLTASVTTPFNVVVGASTVNFAFGRPSGNGNNFDIAGGIALGGGNTINFSTLGVTPGMTGNNANSASTFTFNTGSTINGNQTVNVQNYGTGTTYVTIGAQAAGGLTATGTSSLTTGATHNGYLRLYWGVTVGGNVLTFKNEGTGIFELGGGMTNTGGGGFVIGTPASGSGVVRLMSENGTVGAPTGDITVQTGATFQAMKDSADGWTFPVGNIVTAQTGSLIDLRSNNDNVTFKASTWDFRGTTSTVQQSRADLAYLRNHNLGGSILLGNGGNTTFQKTPGTPANQTVDFYFPDTTTLTGAHTITINNDGAGAGYVQFQNLTAGVSAALSQSGTGYVNVLGVVNNAANKIAFSGGDIRLQGGVTFSASGLGVDINAGATLRAVGNVNDGGTWTGFTNAGVINIAGSGGTLSIQEDSSNVTFTTGGLNLSNADGAILVGGRWDGATYSVNGAVTLGGGRTTTIRNNETSLRAGFTHALVFSGTAILNGAHTFNMVTSPNTMYTPLTLGGGLTTAGAANTLTFSGTSAGNVGALTVAIGAPLTLNGNCAGGTTVAGNYTGQGRLTVGSGSVFFSGAGVSGAPTASGGVDIGAGALVRINEQVGDNATAYNMNNAGVLALAGAGAILDFWADSTPVTFATGGLNLSTGDGQLRAGGRWDGSTTYVNGAVTLGGGRTTTVRNNEASLRAGFTHALVLNNTTTLTGEHTLSLVASPNTMYTPLTLAGGLTTAGGVQAVLNKGGTQNLTIANLTVAGTAPLRFDTTASTGGTLTVSGNLMANDKLSIAANSTVWFTGVGTTPASATGSTDVLAGSTLIMARTPGDNVAMNTMLNAGTMALKGAGATLDLRSNNDFSTAATGWQFSVLDLSATGGIANNITAGRENGQGSKTYRIVAPAGMVKLGNGNTTNINWGRSDYSWDDSVLRFDNRVGISGTHTININVNPANPTDGTTRTYLDGGLKTTAPSTLNIGGTFTFGNWSGAGWSGGLWITGATMLDTTGGKLTLNSGTMVLNNDAGASTGGQGLDIANGASVLIWSDRNSANINNLKGVGVVTIKTGGILDLRNNNDQGTSWVYDTDGLNLSQGNATIVHGRRDGNGARTLGIGGAVTLGGGFTTQLTRGADDSTTNNHVLRFTGLVTMTGDQTLAINRHPTSTGGGPVTFVSGLTLDAAAAAGYTLTLTGLSNAGGGSPMLTIDGTFTGNNKNFTINVPTGNWVTFSTTPNMGSGVFTFGGGGQGVLNSNPAGTVGTGGLVIRDNAQLLVYPGNFNVTQNALQYGNISFGAGGGWIETRNRNAVTFNLNGQMQFAGSTGGIMIGRDNAGGDPGHKFDGTNAGGAGATVFTLGNGGTLSVKIAPAGQISANTGVSATFQNGGVSLTGVQTFNPIANGTGQSSIVFASTAPVALGGASTLDVPGAGSVTFNGVISSAAAANVTKTGTGSVLLRTSNNTFTGDWALNGGTLNIDNNDLRLGDANNDLVFDGGTLYLSGFSWNPPATRTLTFNNAGGTFSSDARTVTIDDPNQLYGTAPLRLINTTLNITVGQTNFSGVILPDASSALIAGGADAFGSNTITLNPGTFAVPPGTTVAAAAALSSTHAEAFGAITAAGNRIEAKAGTLLVPGGRMNIQLALAENKRPRIDVEAYAAIQGDITGYGYGTGASLLNLSENAIVATTGNFPTTGTALYYRGVGASESFDLNLGANVPFKGIALGSDWGNNFAGTIGAASGGAAAIDVYAHSDVTIGSGGTATFNTTDTTTGVQFRGPGKVTFTKPAGNTLAGTATVFTFAGDATQQNKSVVNFSNANAFTAGKTLIVNNGRADVGSATGLAGTLTLNAGSVFYMNQSMTSGTVNVNRNGLVDIYGDGSRMDNVAGLTMTFQAPATAACVRTAPMIVTTTNLGNNSDTTVNANTAARLAQADIVIGDNDNSGYGGSGLTIGNGLYVLNSFTASGQIRNSGADVTDAANGSAIGFGAFPGVTLTVNRNVNAAGSVVAFGHGTDQFTTINSGSDYTRKTGLLSGTVNMAGGFTADSATVWSGTVKRGTNSGRVGDGTTIGWTVKSGGILESTVADVFGGTVGTDQERIVLDGGTLYVNGNIANALRGATIRMNAGSTVWANIGQNGDTDFGSGAGRTIVLGNSTVNVVNSDNGWNRGDKTAYFPPLDFGAGTPKLTVTDSGSLPGGTPSAYQNYSNARFNLGASGADWSNSGEIETTTGDVLIYNVYNTTGLKLTKSGARELYVRAANNTTWTGAGGLTVNAGWAILDTAEKVLGTTTGTEVNGGYLQSNYGSATGPTSALNGSTVTIKSGGCLYADRGTSYHLAGGTIVLNGGTLWANIGNNGDRDFISTATTTSLIKVAGNSALDVVNSDNGWTARRNAAYLGALGFTTAGAKLTVTDRAGYPWETARSPEYNIARFASLGLASGSPWTANGEIETTTGDAIINGNVYDTTGLTLTKSGGRYLYLRGNSAATWSGAGGVNVRAGTVMLDTSADALGTTYGSVASDAGIIQSAIASGANAATITVNPGGAALADRVANAWLGATIRLAGGTLRTTNDRTNPRDFGGTVRTIGGTVSTLEFTSTDYYDGTARHANLTVEPNSRLNLTRTGTLWESLAFLTMTVADGTPGGIVNTTNAGGNVLYIGGAITMGASGRLTLAAGGTLTPNDPRGFWNRGNQIILDGNSAATMASGAEIAVASGVVSLGNTSALGSGKAIVQNGATLNIYAASAITPITGASVDVESGATVHVTRYANILSGGTINLKGGSFLTAHARNDTTLAGSFTAGTGTTSSMNLIAYDYAGDAYTRLGALTMQPGSRVDLIRSGGSYNGFARMYLASLTVQDGAASTLGTLNDNFFIVTGTVTMGAAGRLTIAGNPASGINRWTPEDYWSEWGHISFAGNSSATIASGAEITVNSGVLKLTAANAVGLATVVVNGGYVQSAAANAINNATVRLNTGGVLSVHGLANLLAGGTVVANGGNLWVNTANSGISYGGTLRVDDNSGIVVRCADWADQWGTLATLNYGVAGKTVTVSADDAKYGNVRFASLGTAGTAWANNGGITITTGNPDVTIGAVYDNNTGKVLSVNSGTRTVTLDTANNTTWTGAGGIKATGGTTLLSVANALGTTTGSEALGGTIQAGIANAANAATLAANSGGVVLSTVDSGLAGATINVNAGGIARGNAGGNEHNRLLNAIIRLNGGTLSFRSPWDEIHGGAVTLLESSTIEVEPTDGNQWDRTKQFASLTVSANNKVITFNENTATAGSLRRHRIQNNGTLALGANNVELNVNTAEYFFQNAAVIGSGKITKTGPKYLQFNAASPSWSGGMDINSGGTVFAAGTGGAVGVIGTGTTTINSGAMLSSTAASAVAGATITVNAGGVLRADAGGNAHNYLLNANINLNGGTLRLRSPWDEIHGGFVTLLDNSTIEMEPTDGNQWDRTKQIASLTIGANAKVLTLAENTAAVGSLRRHRIQNNGTLALGANGVTLNITTGFIQNAAVTGTGKITKTGSGAQDWMQFNAASPTWSGGLDVNTGTVYARYNNTGGTVGALGTGTTALASGTTLSLDSSYVDVIKGATVVANGATIYAYSGNVANTLRGATITLNEGSKLILRNQYNNSFGAPVTVGGNVTLEMQGWQNAGYAHPLTGLTVTAPVTLTVTEVSDGGDLDRWLQIDGDIQLGANNVTINTTGTGGQAGAFRQYTTGNLYGSGTITKNGAGDLLLQSNNSGKFTGNVVQNAGTIYAGATKSFGDAPTITVNNSGAVLMTGWGGQSGGANTFGTGTVNLGAGTILRVGQYGATFNAPASALTGATINSSGATVYLHNDAATALGGNFGFEGTGNILSISAANGVSGPHTLGALTIQGSATAGLTVQGDSVGTSDMTASFTGLTMSQSALLTIGAKAKVSVGSITNAVGSAPQLRIDAYDINRTFTLSGGGDNAGFLGDVILNTNAKMILSANMTGGGVTINSGGILDQGASARNLKRLMFNAGASIAGSSVITIGTGGYLGGNGTIDATTMGKIAFATGAGIAPGNANVGTLTVQTGLTLPASAVYYWEVASATSADIINVSSGTFNPGANPTLMIIDAANPPAVQATDEVTIAQWTGTDPAVVTWNVDYGGSNYGSGGRGNTINWDGGGDDGQWDTAANWDKSGFDIGGAVVKYYEADGVTLQPAGGGGAGGYIKVSGMQSGYIMPSSISDVVIKNAPPTPLVVAGPGVARSINSLTLGGGAASARLNLAGGVLTVLANATVQSNGHLDFAAGTATIPSVNNYGQVSMGSGCTANVSVLNSHSGGTVTIASGAGGTVTALNADGGTVNYAGSNVTTANMTGGALNVTGGTLGTANIATGASATQSGGTVGTLGVTGGSVAQSGGAVTTANITGGAVTITGGTMTTTTVNPSGATAATVTGFRGASGSSSLTVSGANASVTTAAGANVGTADFSVGTGTVNALANPLAVTSQLKLGSSVTGTLTGGSSVSIKGANIVGDTLTGADARVITLLGGALTFSGIGGVGPAIDMRSFAASGADGNGNSTYVKASSSYMNDGRAAYDSANGSGMTWSTFPVGTQNTTVGDMWLSNGTTGNGTWIAWDLGASYMLSKVHVWNYNEGTTGRERGIKDLTVQTSTDFSNWTDVPSGISGTWGWTQFGKATGDATDAGQDYSLNGVTTRYVRFNNVSPQSFPGGWGTYVGVSEVVFFQALSPSLNYPNTTLSASASSTIDLGSGSANHTLGALTLTAGATPTTLTVANANSLTFTGGITVTGSAGQAAGIAGSAVRIAGGSVTVPSGVTLSVSSPITGTTALTKVGDGTLTLSGANAYTGATAINGGTVNATHTLALSGTSGVTVGAGTALNYTPTADGQLSVPSLTINPGTGTAIGGAIGSSAEAAMINVTGAANATGSGDILVNITGIPGVSVPPGTTTYTLLRSASGNLLNGSPTYRKGTLSNVNFTLGSLVVTATEIKIAVTDAAPLTTEYWKGGYGGAPYAWTASDGGDYSNWAQDQTGTVTPLTPTAKAHVTFSANSASGTGNMVLGGNMTIKGLTVNESSAVTLNGDGNTLTIGGATYGTTGITIASGAGAVTLSNLALGANQTWANNSANTLTLAGPVACGGYTLAVQGTGNTTISGAIANTAGITKTGAGVLTLGNAAHTVTSIGVSEGTLTVNGGAVTTANLSGTGTLNGSGTVTTVNATTGGTPTFGGKATTLNVSNAGTTLAVGAGATVGTADFSAGTGTVNALANPLAVASQLKLGSSVTGTLTGGTSFTVRGANIVTDTETGGNARGVTLSGGTFAVSGVPPLPSVAGLKLRLEADMGVTQSGGYVSTWADQSGNGFNAIQGTSANQPAFVAGASANGLFPAIRFDGSRTANGDSFTGTGQLPTGSNSAFLVYKPDVNPGGAGNEEIPLNWGGSVGGNGRLRCFYLTGPSGSTVNVGHAIYGGTEIATKYTVTANTFHVGSWTDVTTGTSPNLTGSVTLFDHASGGSIVNKGTYVYSGSTTPPTGYLLGGTPIATLYNYPYKGDIFAVLVYDGALSDSDRQAVDNYLYNKYFGSGAGAINYPNTTLTVTAGSTLDLSLAGSDHTLGTLTLTAGATATTLTLANAASVTFSGITVTGSAGQSAAVTGSPVRIATGGDVSVPSGVTLTLQSVMSGTGALSKTGSGSVVLPAGLTHTYSGVTTVSAGTLQVSGTLNAGGGTVTVANGGTLTGAGTISRNLSVQAGGTLSPGVGGIGTLTVTGALSLAGQGTFEVTKYNGARTNDKITGLTSAPNITGSTLTVSLSGGGFVHGDKWKLLEWTGGGSIAGTLSTEPPRPTGFKWHNFGTEGSPNYIDPTTGEIQVDGIPAAKMTFTAPAHLARALVNTTKAVDATVKNIGHADWNGISFSDGLGDMTVDSFNPAVAFDLAIDAQRGFTASVAAGLTRGERGFKVKADNGSFNVVSNRLLTVVGPRTFDAMAVAAFGRVMANQAVSGGSRTLAGATTTPDNYYANPQLPTGAAGSSGGVSLNNAGAAVTFDVANGSKSAALTVSGNFAGTGLHSGSVPITSLIAELSESYSVSVPYSATALADRTFTGDAIAFGVIHIDGTGSASTTIRTGGASDSYTSVAVPGNSDLVVTIANDATVFNGAMNLARSATTAAIRTAGNFSGSVTLNPGMEADVGGTQSPQSFVVGYSGQVFSGNATWSGVGGVWGDRTTNAGGWADDNVVVPAIHAAPGTFGWPFDDEDQATFSGDGGIVSLNSVSPSVKTLIFGGANGYTIAQGTGGTLFLKETTSASITTSGSATHQIGAPVNLASDVVVVTDVDLALSGGLGGAGALTKLGTGTLTLSGAIGYAGVTTVSAGTLVVNGTMNTQVNAVSVTSTTSAKLTGTGSLARPVSIGDKGTIEPTGATGTLTVKSLTMASGATFAVAASGATCGQLVVSGGAVSLGDGVATLSLSGTAAGSPLTLVTDASGVSGYFKDESGTPLTEGTSVTFGGRTFRISYTGGKVMLGGAAEGTLFLIR